METNILEESLFNAYQNKDYETINNIMTMNVLKMDKKLYQYLKHKTLDEIHKEIICFNLAMINNKYKRLPIYFFDDSWIILEITNVNSSPINYKGKVIESSYNNLKNELRINDLIKESHNGILNFMKFIK